MTTIPTDLPETVRKVLSEVTTALVSSLDADLRSLVLYGSAAEGRMRSTSDVNLVAVLSIFDAAKIDGVRESLRLAHSTLRLEVMFLLESEIDAAAEAFAVKFEDIGRRRRVLFGADPFANLRASRLSRILRLRQMLLNLVLHLRRAYVLKSLREEQCVAEVADAAGPLRAAASTLLDLSNSADGTGLSPKAALERVANGLDPAFTPTLARMSEAREKGSLAAGGAASTLIDIIRLADAMRARAESLSELGS